MGQGKARFVNDGDRDDRPMLDRQANEDPRDLVAIGEAGAGIRLRGERDDGQGDAIASPPSSLVPDGTDEDAVQPRAEPRWISQLRQITPAANESLLDGVGWPVVIPEDQSRQSIHGLDGLGDEDVVRVRSPFLARRTSSMSAITPSPLVSTDCAVDRAYGGTGEGTVQETS